MREIKHYTTITFAILAFLHMSSCKQESSKKQEVEPPEKIAIAEEYTPGSMTQRIAANGASYSLYLPAGLSKNKKYSVIVLLDPHGKSNFPINKYKGLADKFNVVLMASSDSKNGMQMEEGIAIVQRLMDECKTFSFFNNHVSLAGFSGGAKLAIVAGNSVSKFNSIIYCGAALPPQSLRISIPMLGIAGTKDMNYTEVKNFYNWAGSQIQYNGVVEWKGKHEWPDSAAFQRAFYWHMLNSDLDKKHPLITEYIQFIDRLSTKESNPLRKAEMLSNRAAVLEHYQSTKEYKYTIRKILLSPEYTKAKAAEALVFANEDNRKQEFISSFETRDINWWKEQINNLSNNKTESNERLLGYISLASWSYSNKAVEQNAFPFAQKTLQIYQLADPDNSEHEFLRACLYAKNNSPDSAVFYLKEAVKLGLDDRSKIENEKNLATLHGRDDFNQVVAQLKY